MEETYDYTVKLLLLGSTAVGKSSLLIRFTEDVFKISQHPTIGANYHNRMIEIDGKKIKLQIWDTASAELFRRVIHMYLRSVNGIVLVYDVTNRSSFNNTSKWICDIEEIAMDYGIKFLETSAKSGINVEEAFFTLIRDIMSRMDRKMNDCNPSDEGPVNISESPSNKSLCCCCCCPLH
ncbi:ras-related protein Rab-8B-like isoform X2 [Acanthochromis polyacanthus]|uniref:ras-related protein Rab-8B-like isoform X2 n=1 Tax=Acanthochromis polyacanthus TaxID=80966 RepID=UPI002234725C|nr:ras-related protein Rab-8B-like isoform X2 [Acanthochromis polyacanthus]